MPIDVLIRITKDSQRGRAIQKMADQQDATPEQIIERMIDEGVRTHAKLSQEEGNGKTPAEMLMGLFSSPENTALMDEVTAMAYEGRNASTTRDIGL
jgi:hypothetical protein